MPDGEKQKRYFNALIVVPLEEEFQTVMDHVHFEENLSTNKHIRFVISLPDHKAKFLLIKQSMMGRTACQEALNESLNDFDCGILICIGIAGALSSDLSIGDVCYSSSVLDVLDNAKIAETPSKSSVKQHITLSPTYYSSPRELTIPIALDRISPVTKSDFLSWVHEREAFGKSVIPGEFTGRHGKETIGAPHVWEGVIVCGLVSGSPEYNAKILSIDRKALAIETEFGGLFSVAQQHDLPAITFRGISDYAGVDKSRFERETGNRARKVAAANATSFMARQLQSPAMLSYLDQLSVRRASDASQLPLIKSGSPDAASQLLIKRGEDFASKLRDLAPAYSLHFKGYRLPVPRIRTVDMRSGAPRPRDGQPIRGPRCLAGCAHHNATCTSRIS